MFTKTKQIGLPRIPSMPKRIDYFLDFLCSEYAFQVILYSKATVIEKRYRPITRTSISAAYMGNVPVTIKEAYLLKISVPEGSFEIEVSGFFYNLTNIKDEINVKYRLSRLYSTKPDGIKGKLLQWLQFNDRHKDNLIYC